MLKCFGIFTLEHSVEENDVILVLEQVHKLSQQKKQLFNIRCEFHTQYEKSINLDKTFSYILNLQLTNVTFGRLCVNLPIPAPMATGALPLCANFFVISGMTTARMADLELGERGEGREERSVETCCTFSLSHRFTHLSITSIGRWAHERQIFNLT